MHRVALASLLSIQHCNLGAIKQLPAGPAAASNNTRTAHLLAHALTGVLAPLLGLVSLLAGSLPGLAHRLLGALAHLRCLQQGHKALKIATGQWSLWMVSESAS